MATTVTKKKPAEKAPAKKPAAKNTGKDYVQAVGRRKTAVASVRLTQKGSGKFVVNGKAHKEYFPYGLWREEAESPLPLVGQAEADISVKVSGGGPHAQAQAVRLGVARALLLVNEDWRPTLRKMGWLTRDAREKERKKPGLKRARRAPQWTKR